MDSEFYRIISALCDFLEGLFFGFCLVTLLTLLIYIFVKRKELRLFINYAALVAKNLAILYLVIYSVSLGIYYSSIEFDYFRERATGPYAWAYWFMLIRPLVFCLLLQLFWIEKIIYNLSRVFIVSCLVLIVSLFSATFIERFVIISTSYSRDYYDDNSQLTTDIAFIIASYIIENMVLFSALVFISWFIFKKRKA